MRSFFLRQRATCCPRPRLRSARVAADFAGSVLTVPAQCVQDSGWAIVLWSPYALGTRTLLWLGHAWSPHDLGTRTLLWLGHARSGHRMIFEGERHYALGISLLSAGIVLGSLPHCLLCSQVCLPVPLHGQLHAWSWPVSRPTFGVHGKSCFEAQRRGICMKYCPHLYYSGLSR